MSNERDRERVKAYLQTAKARQEVRKNIKRVRSEATLSIGGVNKVLQDILPNISVPKLRNWEASGLLRPTRSQESGGQRHYNFAELEKLAVISVLITSGFGPSEIPEDVDDIWKEIAEEVRQSRSEAEYPRVDERTEGYQNELLWRYFIPRILRLLLMLLSEENSLSQIGLVLPLQEHKIAISQTDELHSLGESLLAFLKDKRLLYTTVEPVYFLNPTEFQVRLVSLGKDAESQERSAIIIFPKKENLHFEPEVMEIMKPILLLLYQHAEVWSTYFDQGMRDSLELITDFSLSNQAIDSTLNGLAEKIVDLGGKMLDGSLRWRVCGIAIPDDTSLPLLQRSITVQAKSANAHYKIGGTTVKPSLDNLIRSVSLQALQSGRVIYRPTIGYDDPIIFKKQQEGDVRSSIAIPIGAEDGHAVAVIYVASDYEDAFSLNDQRVLRVIGRVVEELISTYHIRQQVNEKLNDLMQRPLIVDPSLRDVQSSNKFILEVEKLLSNIQKHSAEEDNGEYDTFFKQIVSFIAIDVDNLGDHAAKHGDALIKNLSAAIYDSINSYFGLYVNSSFKVFFVYGSKFYIFTLQNVPLNGLKGLREALTGKPTQFTLAGVTVTLAMTTFTYMQLRDALKTNSSFASPVVETRVMINRTLDAALKKGMEAGETKHYSGTMRRKNSREWTYLSELKYPGSRTDQSSITLVQAINVTLTWQVEMIKKASSDSS